MEHQNNYLEQLRKISEQLDDGGLIHPGIIHFIQQRTDDFILKDAIYEVLENVPNVFPKNLPELVESSEFQPTPEIIETIFKINNKLLMPIGGEDVIKIIKLAREYEIKSKKRL